MYKLYKLTSKITITVWVQAPSLVSMQVCKCVPINIRIAIATIINTFAKLNSKISDANIRKRRVV